MKIVLATKAALVYCVGMKTNSQHWITEPNMHFGQVAVYGISTWNIPDGQRLRREMQRSTLLSSVKAMEKWAKKYGLDVKRQSSAWRNMVTPEVAI